MRTLFVFLAAISALAQSVQRGGELRVAIQAEPKSSDPHIAADEPSELLAYLTHGVLVRLNRATQQPEPALASSWAAMTGGKGIVFTLREGGKFSDGASVSAADVCHSLGRITDPKLDAPNGDALRGAAGRVTCQTAGAKVEVQFEKPLAAAERWFDGIAILPADGRERVGAGPFRIGSWQAGSAIRLERNPHYWKRDAGGASLPYLDAIRLEVQRNRDLELMRFESGELHLVNNLDPEAYERLRAKSPTSVVPLGPSLDTEQLWFNQVPTAPIDAARRAWFAKPAFRNAVSLAIRRADLARIVYRGHASPAAGPISPANRLWVNTQLRPARPDPAAALARLRAAGFELRAESLYDSTGHLVEFTIITNAGNRNRERMAAMIQQDLGAIGIRVRVTPLDFPSLIARITRTFDYDACLLGLVTSDLDPNHVMNVWLSSAANHQWNPNQKTPATPWEAEIDRLMQSQALEQNQARRKLAFDRVQAIAVEQSPFLYLVHRNAMVALSPRLRGAKPTALRPQVLWNAEMLWLQAPTDGSGR